MARLTIEQVQAPDFSASAELMRGAAASFDKGLESAQGILANYNKGQQAKDDTFVLNELGKVRNEQELDNLLGSDFLVGRNISETLRGNLYGVRGDTIGNVNDRDTNTRANAVEGRAASEYTDSVNARAERRGLTGAYVRSLEEGQTTGTASGVVAGVDLGAVEQNYNLPGGYMATMAQIESGGDPNAQNSESSAGGLFQQIDSNAEAYGVANRFDPAQSADGAARFAVDNANTLRKVLGRDPTGAELYLAHQQGPGGATALLSNPNARAVDVVGADAVRLNGGSADMTAGEFAGIWINKFNKIQGNSGGVSTQPVTSVGNGGPAAQTFRDALANSMYMEPGDAAAFLQENLDVQLEADKRISAAEQLRQTELANQATIDAISDPNNTTTAEVQRDLLDTGGLDAGRRLGLAGANYDQYGNIIAPAVTANPQVTAAAELAAAEAARSNELDPTIQAFEEAKAYESTEGGAGAALTANLGEAATGVLAPDNVNRQLESFAKANNITVGEAAVVFNSVAQGNADQLAAQIEAASDTDMFANLSSIADRMFGDEARSAYQDGQLSDVAAGAQRDTIQANILVAKTEAAKLPPGSSERAAAEENIRLLEVGSIAANQPQKTKAQTASYLGIEPAQMAELSPEDKKAAEDAIRGNPDLSTEEKTLLIMGLRL
jgi:hypothetical protein